LQAGGGVPRDDAEKVLEVLEATLIDYLQQLAAIK
jgi:hypothetical protein